MKLWDIVHNLKQILDDNYKDDEDNVDYEFAINEHLIDQDRYYGEEVYVLNKIDIMTTTIERVAIIKGGIEQFEIVLAKELSPDIRRLVFGWYLSLFRKRSNSILLTIKGNRNYKLYYTGTIKLAIWDEDSKNYSLFVELPITTRDNAEEVVLQLAREIGEYSDDSQ